MCHLAAWLCWPSRFLCVRTRPACSLLQLAPLTVERCERLSLLRICSCCGGIRSRCLACCIPETCLAVSAVAPQSVSLIVAVFKRGCDCITRWQFCCGSSSPLDGPAQERVEPAQCLLCGLWPAWCGRFTCSRCGGFLRLVCAFGAQAAALVACVQLACVLATQLASLFSCACVA